MCCSLSIPFVILMICLPLIPPISAPPPHTGPQQTVIYAPPHTFPIPIISFPTFSSLSIRRFSIRVGFCQQSFSISGAYTIRLRDGARAQCGLFLLI